MNNYHHSEQSEDVPPLESTSPEIILLTFHGGSCDHRVGRVTLSVDIIQHTYSVCNSQRAKLLIAVSTARINYCSHIAA